MKNQYKRFVFKLFAVAVSLFIACPYAFAGDVGVVTYAEGRVDVLRAGSDTVAPLRSGEAISVGDAIRTKSNSKAEIAFNDKSVLRLAQNTRVEVKDYTLDGKNNRKSADILLDRGKLRTIIAKMPDSAEFAISTPNAEGRVKGSDIFAFYQSGNSGMLVADGRLSVINTAHPESKIIIPAGNSVVVPLDESPKGPRKYFELEKKMHEQDTDIPPSISRRENASIIKGVVVKLSGKVTITEKGAGSARVADINDIVGAGDTIETGSDGLVEIKFDNGNGLNLKPGSLIVIKELVIDPKTGEYVNLFESTKGKIRARIENLKGASTFKVKTPVAVCGARGTIMYLEITPTAVRAFFEGGNGYIGNIISGLERTVAIAQNAAADDQGGVSNPAQTSDEDRLEWGSGWTPGSGIEGYSAPDGTAGVYLNMDETNGTISILNGSDLGAGNGNGPFSDVPFGGGTNPPGATGGETETITETAEEITSSGILDADKYHYDSYDGTLEGAIGLLGSFWNSGESAELISAGNISSGDGNDQFIWRGRLYSNDPATDSHMTYDGGAFAGIVAGIGNRYPLGESIVDILDGLARVIYIDPAGNAGIAGGDLAGLYSFGEDSGSGVYVLGTTNFSSFHNFGNIGISPEDLYDSLWDGWWGDGHTYGELLEGYDDFHTTSIVNYETGASEPWGIYEQIIYDGSFEGDLSGGWTARSGGRDYFGAYSDYMDEYEGAHFTDDEGYWIVDLTNGGWSDRTVSADVSGKFLTYTKMGDISGRLIGTYDDESGTWQAVNVGEWIGKALTFSGLWGGEDSGYPNSIYRNSGGYFDWVGEDYGLIGATVSRWWNEVLFPFLAMGAYYYSDYGEEEAYVWNTPIQGYNAIDDENTTIDGGAFYGFTAGTLSGQTARGALAAIYVADNGDGGYDAGLLTGNLAGHYYYRLGSDDYDADIYGMWMAEGALSPVILGRDLDVDPRDIVDDIINNESDLSVSMFDYYEGNGPDFELGGDSYGYTYFISGQSWGIYTMKLEGGEDGGMNSEGPGVWGGMVYGSGRFGDVNSRGILEGDVFGVESGDSWIAASVGTWMGDPYEDFGNNAGGGDGVYYGFIGGVVDEGLITGKALALYAQPGDAVFEEGSLVMEDDGYTEGSFQNGDSEIGVEYFDGKTVSFKDESWGIFGTRFGGSYSGEPAGQFGMIMAGTSDSNKGNDGGYWMAIMTGFKYPDSSIISGIIRGLVLGGDKNDDALETFLLSGNMMGALYDDYSWEGAGVGRWTFQDLSERSYPEDIDDFMDMIGVGEFTGSGSGVFASGGDITIDYLSGVVASIDDQRWGIWASILGGTCQDGSGLFRIAMIGSPTSQDSDIADSYIFMSAVGYSDPLGIITARSRGIWMASEDGDMVRAGIIPGDMTGYIDVDEEGVRSWHAAGAGEWVEVTDLLNQYSMFDNGLSDLNQFVNMPITEVYNTAMTGAGNFSTGGAINVTNMDMSFYALSPTALNGVWSALISGNYTPPPTPSDNWNVVVNSNDGATATLAGTQWNNNQWVADVSGNANGANFTGQAGGTYTDPGVSGSGTFSGVGAGTFTAATPPGGGA